MGGTAGDIELSGAGGLMNPIKPCDIAIVKNLEQLIHGDYLPAVGVPRELQLHTVEGGFPSNLGLMRRQHDHRLFRDDGENNINILVFSFRLRSYRRW